MKIHPLKQAYNQYILEHYGVKIYGDKYERTAVIAQKVAALGIPYDIFIDVAVGLWDGWATKQGHPYPYWNMVVCDKTFERLKPLVDNAFLLDDSEYWEAYTNELEFAHQCIKWLLGECEDKPHRVNGKPPVQVQIYVAECVCSWYNIPCLSSNYVAIAKEIQRG